MKITTIEIPIYELDIVVIMDDWVEANKKFKLQLSEDDLKACAWTIYDEPHLSHNEIFILLRHPHLEDSTVLHEMMHVISGICRLRHMTMDPDNDEPLAYLQGYIGEKVLSFRDKHLEIPNQ